MEEILNLADNLVKEKIAEYELSFPPDDKGPNDYYEVMKSRFLEFLDSFSNWDEYLQVLNENRMNPNFVPEELFHAYQQRITISYLQKYPYLKRYNPYFAEFKDYLKANKIQIHHLSSSRNGIQITAEFINIPPDHVYYPHIKFMCSIHSALHSLGMLLKGLKEYEFRKYGVAIYERPATTHPGDEEYTRYYCEQLKIQLIILKRRENPSFHLQRNRAPKIGKMGRWCSRVFKTEPIKVFYKTYFYPAEARIQHKYTKKYLLHLLDQQQINYPKILRKAHKHEVINFVRERIRRGLITSKYKSKYQTSETKFPLSEWKNGEWIPTNTKSNRCYLYRKERNAQNHIIGFKEYGVMPIRSIVEFIGIAKYQSSSRAKKNPNVHLKQQIANPEKEFLFYEHYPIFHEKVKDLKDLVDKANLQQNPYELEYGELDLVEQEENPQETRFGCVLCPYKSESFYEKLKKGFPEIYYYARFLLLLCSAYNLIEQKRQYFYYEKSKVM